MVFCFFTALAAELPKFEVLNVGPKAYKGVTVTAIEPSGIRFIHDSGTGKAKFEELDAATRAKFPPADAIPPAATFKFVDTKTEGRNVMDLYAYSGTIERDALVAFCAERKRKAKGSAFYYVVIFDSAANARFPSSPFTAEYGGDEGASKHIRAIYCFNGGNGYSKVTFHQRNIFEYKAQVTDI